MTWSDLLQDAITQRHAVLLRLTGDGLPKRVVHPHALYLDKERDLRLAALQIKGFTTTGSLPAWRTLRVSRISTVERLEQPFAVDPGWNPDAPQYRGGIVVMV